VWGIGSVLGEDSPYGTFPDDALKTARGPARAKRGIRTVDTYADGALDDLRERAIADFIERIDGWVVPEAMAQAPAPAPTDAPLASAAAGGDIPAASAADPREG